MVHLRFEESVEDDMEEDMPLAAAPSIGHVTSATFRLPACCAMQSVGSAYVFKADMNQSLTAVVASTSDCVIKAYSISSNQMAHVCDLAGHGGTISEVMFTDAQSMLHSSSADGTVRGWDLRTGRQVESYSMRQELHSFACLDHLLAVGGQGEVFFWDRRAAVKPVLSFPDTHMEDVTQV